MYRGPGLPMFRRIACVDLSTDVQLGRLPWFIVHVQVVELLPSMLDYWVTTRRHP